MAKKQFKAESKRLLDLMINSIYTHKEIFLRELISNASDAIDKMYYRELSEGSTGINREDFRILLEVNRDEKTLKIIDNGVGMSKDELEKNLGTIAKSGSLEFKKKLEDSAGNADAQTVPADQAKASEQDKIDIIGQFGVGFYSAFMVSDKVEVLSKAYGSDEAFVWESQGVDGYTVKEAEAPDSAFNGGGHGTEITLTLKEDTEEEKYSLYLETYTIRNLIRRYSDYINYPIQMMVEKSRVKEGT